MKHNHYKRDVSQLQVIDVYRVIELFGVTCPVAQHVLKKSMAAGQRLHKDLRKDWEDIRDSAERRLQMMDEDGAAYFALAGESAAKERNGGWDAQAIKSAALPASFGQQNMIDPADVELYEEPAAAIDDESPRADAIGQNGNTGEHYYATWAGAPEWVKCKAQDADGEWYFYEREPHIYSGDDQWYSEHKLVNAAIPNPNWRTTLISR